MIPRELLDRARDLRELFRRWLCRRLQHRWTLVDVAAPVTTFWMCRRCGKWER